MKSAPNATKGLYAKAFSGEIKEIHRIDPYEAPENPEIALKTAEEEPRIGCGAARLPEERQLIPAVVAS